MKSANMAARGAVASAVRLISGMATGVAGMTRSCFASYVDNPISTPYRPRETVASGEGERFATSTVHPYVPHIPTAPSVAFFQSPQPTLDWGLSGLFALPPLCVVDTGRCAPRPQMFCGADARGPSGHPLSGSDPNHAYGS